MKIAIAAGFKANYGGNFIEQAKILGEKIEKNHGSVIYIFPILASEKSWCKELLSDNKNVIFIDNNVNVVFSLFILIRIIIKYKINCIHTNFGFLDIYSAIICLFIPRFKHIIHARAESNNPKNRYRYLLQVIKHQYIYRKSFVITVSNNIKKEYVGFGFNETRIKTLENGIFFQRLFHGRSKEILKREFGVKEDSKIFLMMGYDIIIKGVDIACNAFSKLKEQKDTELYILGIVVASNLDYIKNQIQLKYGEIPKWILLLPPNENIGDYYRLADCFISASRTEGFSYAIAESIAMKLPVIVSDIKGTQWSLRFQSVVSFVNEDHMDLCDKIHNIFIIMSEKKVLDASNAIQFEYGIEKWVDKIINFYKFHKILK